MGESLKMHVSVSPALRAMQRTERPVSIVGKLVGLLILGVAVAVVIGISQPRGPSKLDANTIVSPFDVTNAPPPSISRDAVKVVVPRRMLPPQERARVARDLP